MKRTFRSLLSMVMALSMLLSMVLISGLTASAATNVSLVTGVAPGMNNANIAASGADGLGVTLSTPWTDATGYGYTYWNFTTPQITATPYLVVDITDSTLGNFGGYCNLTYGWLGADLGSVRSGDKQVIDLRTIDDGASAVCLCLTLNGTVSFDALYLSDTMPAVEPINVPVISIATPYNNANTTATADGLGATFATPWKDATGYGYAYFNFTWAQITRTPYLVIDIDDASVNVMGGRFDIGYTYGGPVVTSLNSAAFQVVDLRTVAQNYETEGKNLDYFCLHFTFTDSVTFDALYLTNVAPSAPVSKYPVKDMTVSLGNVTPTASGEGVIFTVPAGATGDQYTYYERIPAPYLVYKLKEGSPSSTIAIAADVWWGGAVYLPAPSTTETVVDLTALPCYSASSNMLLQNLFTATTEFEYFYFTTEATPNVNYLEFETNGGTAIPAGCVVAGTPFSATVKEGYAFGGWYTDAALTQAFDLATVYEGATTLYAKWVLAGDISPVFGQLQTGTTVESASTAIRFAAAIDSRDFAEAGFVFSKVTANPTVDDAASLAVSTTTVWTSINAAGSTVTADELHGSYIFACTVNNISNANFGTALYVRAYVKDFEGNYTYTDAKTYSVNAMLG